MKPTDNVRFDPHIEKPEAGAAKWISTHEAALLLGVSARSVQRQCQAGTLPARRVQGERREVWEVEAGAVEQKARSDSDVKATATQRQTRATRTKQRQIVAVASPIPCSNEGNSSDDRKSDSDTAVFKSDSDTIPSVALEAERLRAQLEASRAETERERELNTFLKSQIEEGNRNAAELRKALNEALKIAPRQLEARRADEGAPNIQQRTPNGAAGSYPKAEGGPRTSAKHEEQGGEISTDELLELCRRISPLN